MLKENTRAPDFCLKDKDGNLHRLSDIKSDFVLIFFYPKDNTPGCTIEAKGFSKELKKFEKLNTTVIGISGGDEKSKTKFCEKHDLKVLLLSDPDFEVSKKYGAYGEKSFMGKKFMGINRMSFLLDAKRKIRKVYSRVKPGEHVKGVLAEIMELPSE